MDRRGALTRRRHHDFCRCTVCIVRVARVQFPQRLPIFTVFDSPTDFVGFVVVRLFLNDAATHWVWTYDSIEAARAGMPPGFVRLERSEGDHPSVVESWI